MTQVTNFNQLIERVENTISNVIATPESNDRYPDDTAVEFYHTARAATRSIKRKGQEHAVPDFDLVNERHAGVALITRAMEKAANTARFR